MIQSFSQWTTSELNFPKVAVHFLSVCDEWLWLLGNSDPLSHSLNSHITFSTKRVAAYFSKKKKSYMRIRRNVWELNVQISFLYETFIRFQRRANILDGSRYSLFISARISFLCLNSRPYSEPKFWHCSQMRPWPCTSLSVALYSTAALSGRDSMTCFPASSWIAAGTSLQPVD